MGDEFSASSLPRFVGWTLAIDEARIVAAMDSVDLPEAARPGPQERGHVAVEAGHAQRLARRLAALFESLATGETPLDSSAITDELAFQIPLDLARAFASGTLPARTASSRSRDIAIRRAIEYIEDNRGEPLTVRDLVREAGVGWTTLVHAFHEHFGVTPKAYLQAVRLVGVRRDLREADRGTLIADVANRWGFWHQGQFAADYRRKFGELPSETLARASAGSRWFRKPHAA
jgi:AraC family ethanolamine operon transcriptional activator